MSDPAPAPAPPEKPKSKGSKPGPPSAAKEVDRSNEINAPSRSGARQLRTAVAKPAEIYTAQWGKGDDAEASPKPKKGTHDDDIERVVGKRRRSGRTEYLVKWGDGSPNSWEAPRTIDPALVEQYEEKKKRRQMSSQAVGDDDGRVAQRILAQRRMEGGKRYLVHWRGRTVAQATWEPAAVLGELVGEFEAAVRRAAPSRHRPARPPPLARARVRRRSLTSPFPRGRCARRAR